MKEDKSEVIATSNDLCNPDQTILIAGEDDYVIIHNEKKVNHDLFSASKRSKFLPFISPILGRIVFHFGIEIPQKSTGNRGD